MESRTLLVILLIALVGRAGLLATLWTGGEDRIYTPDSQAYIQLAHSLAKDGTFHRDGRPEIFRTPGYPLALAGTSVWGENWWRAALVGQVVLDVALVYLTFLLGWMLVGERGGLVAAALMALEPLAAAACLRILSDSLYAFLLTLAVLLLVHDLRHEKRWAGLAAGFVLGAACYVRPAGLAMSAVAAGALVLVGGARRWARAGAVAGIVAVAVAPWVVRNAMVADYRGFSSFAGDAMYYFAAPEVVAAAEGASAAEVREEMRDADAVASAGKTPGEAASWRQGEAMRILGEHPGLYARIHATGCVGVFLPAATDVLQTAGVVRGERGTIDVLHAQGLGAAVRHYFGDNPAMLILAAPLLVATLAQYLGTAVCVVKAARLRIPPAAWLMAALVVAAVLLPGPFGLPRYRLAITPLLCVAAGVGLTRQKRQGEEEEE